MQDSCITVQEKVVVPNIPVVEEEIICPQPQTQVQEREGYLLVKTGMEESGKPFIVVTSAISCPDNSDFSDWKEVTEQEALELQEKYNTENGNNNFRN